MGQLDAINEMIWLLYFCQYDFQGDMINVNMSAVKSQLMQKAADNVSEDIMRGCGLVSPQGSWLR